MSSTTSDVQKVRWLPSVESDGVHSGHSEACSISEDANIPLSCHVLQVIAVGNALARVDLGAILLSLEFCLPEEGIVINDDLVTCSYDLLVPSVYKGVQFYKLGITLYEAIV